MKLPDTFIATLDSILNESQHSISDNPGYGYHGTVDPKVHNSKRKNSPLHGDDEKARAHHYKKMHQTVRSVTGADAKTAKHYLDSKHGRHLADVHNDNTSRGLALSHTHNYIKKDFDKFKKHYKPEFFESYEGEIDLEAIDEGYTSSNYDKDNDHPSKSKTTFIKGVHGDESEHIRTIKHAAGGKITDEHAKKIAHHPDYHAHAYAHRHAISRGGSIGFDNGVKKLAGTHPHHPDKAGAIHEGVEDLQEMPDSGSFKAGDRVRVHAPSSAKHNERGIYAGIERGRHVVKHSDGSRSVHGSGALIKESRSDFIKSLVKEEVKSADKKPEYARTPAGKMIVKLVTRKRDVVDAGGKDGHNETENK